MTGHVVPHRTYYAVFGSLLALLALTVAAAEINLGALNVVVAMTISVAKALLIVLFFMHVWYGRSLIRLFAVAGFVWLAVLISLTMSDYLTRGWS